VAHVQTATYTRALMNLNTIEDKIQIFHQPTERRQMVEIEKTLQTIADDASYTWMPKHPQAGLPVCGFMLIGTAKSNVATNQP